MLTPGQKAASYANTRRSGAPLGPPLIVERASMRGIELMMRFALDEALSARRLHQGLGGLASAINSVPFDDRVRRGELRRMQAEKRRLMWHSLSFAVREFALALAACVSEEPLSPDESGADVDLGTRLLVAWLVDIGREVAHRRRR